MTLYNIHFVNADGEPGMYTERGATLAGRRVTLLLMAGCEITSALPL